MLSDIRGKSLPAIEVFALSIQCLKHHLLTNLLKEGVDIKESAIQWVLTVPSIWSDTAKHFMRQSAEKVIQNISFFLTVQQFQRNQWCVEIRFVYELIGRQLPIHINMEYGRMSL